MLVSKDNIEMLTLGAAGKKEDIFLLHRGGAQVPNCLDEVHILSGSICFLPTQNPDYSLSAQLIAGMGRVREKGK